MDRQERPIIYLSGPTEDLEPNAVVFHDISELLAKEFPGYQIYCPIDLLRAFPDQPHTWYMLSNRPLVLAATFMFLLPDWFLSRDSRTEVIWRSSANKPGFREFINKPPTTWQNVSPAKVLLTLRDGILSQRV